MNFGVMHGDILQPGTPSLGHPRTALRMLLSCPCGPNAQLSARVSGYNLWTCTASPHSPKLHEGSGQGRMPREVLSALWAFLGAGHGGVNGWDTE